MNPGWYYNQLNYGNKTFLFSGGKETLACWVIRLIDFLRHWSCQTCDLSNLDPSMPPIMTASITMDDGFFSWWERGNSFSTHSICKLCVIWCSYCPGNQHLIQTVYNRRKIHLISFNWEFCNICQPPLFGLVSMKIFELLGYQQSMLFPLYKS